MWARRISADYKQKWYGYYQEEMKNTVGGRIGFGFQLGFVNVEQGIETIHKEVDKRFL